LDLTPPVHAVYAIRYATVAKRASENFVDGDPHDGPMPMDYFVWLITGPQGNFVVDTGFGAAAAAARKRTLLRSPIDGLAALGVRQDEVSDVIITHLHYDHAGNLDQFPAATFHIQDAEMAFATGRLMTHSWLRVPYSIEDVVDAVRNVHVGRVRFHHGDSELAPGISLHLVGGHSGGLQVVRVWTQAGWLVLASDASHYYANIEEGRPFPIVADVGAMLEGWNRLRSLASAPKLIIPGHDPLVMQRFPAAGPGLEGIAVRLDARLRRAT